MILFILKPLFKCILAFLVLAGLYMLAAYTLPYITVNNSFRNSDREKGIKIFILSNGVHTDFVVPAATPYKNWQTEFAPGDFNAKNLAYAYIGFGWGDKGFYLNTPEWSDLKFSTAFKAVFWLSSTAMHVTYRKEPNPDEDCVELVIDEATYNKLITCIENGFKKNERGIIYIDHPGYGQHDRFYEANGTYSLFKTCNNWTNNGLKEIGVKTAVWSPFAKGLLHSLKN